MNTSKPRAKAEDSVSRGEGLSRRSFLYRGAVVGAGVVGVPGLLAACGGGGSSEAGELSTFYTTTADEYFTSHIAGTEQAAAAFGFGFEGFANEQKPDVIINQYETAGSRGVEAMTVVPPSDAPIPVLAQRANGLQANTYFLGESPPWFFPFTEGEYAVGFSAPYDFVSYNDVASLLMRELGNKGNVLMITGFPGGTADTFRTAGGKEAIAEAGGVKLLGSLPGKWNRIDGRAAMEDLMTSHPDFDGVLALNDDMAVGALSALSDAGRSDVPIVGHNGTSQAADLIKEGRMLASAASFPFWQGAWAVARVYDALNGYEFSLPERMMLSGHVVVTSNNVDEFIQKYVQGIDSLPLDFKKMSRVEHPDDWDPQNRLISLNPDEYWRLIPQPDDKPVPPEYAEVWANGEAESVNAEFEEHYQAKILSA